MRADASPRPLPRGRVWTRWARAGALAAVGLSGARALAGEPQAGPLARTRQLLDTRAAIVGNQAAMAEGGARWRARELYRYLQVSARAGLRQPEADRARALAVGLRALERDRNEARTLDEEAIEAREDRARLDRSPDHPDELAGDASSIASSDASSAGSPPPSLVAPIAGGVLVALFGPGREPSTGVWLNRSGARLRGRAGAPVRAVGAGVVRRVAPSPAGGLALVVDHGGGWTSIVAGLAEVGVTPGARIARGDRVGYLGPGQGAGPELVLELWRGRTAVDPRRHIAIGAGQ
jgi:murein DD-endopeptidase MepM/ murein hydrolase activator NlpD